MPKAAQHAACAIGSQRFEEFAAQVGRRVHLGRPLMRETLDRISVTSPHLFRVHPAKTMPRSAQNRTVKGPSHQIYGFRIERQCRRTPGCCPGGQPAVQTFRSEVSILPVRPFGERCPAVTPPEIPPLVSTSSQRKAASHPVRGWAGQPHLLIQSLSLRGRLLSLLPVSDDRRTHRRSIEH